MRVSLEYQVACDDTNGLPAEKDIRNWVEITLQQIGYADDTAQLSVRIVDDAEMKMLNKQFRGKDKTTNVLSFPFTSDEFSDADDMRDYLGDIVISRAVVAQQAHEQAKTFNAHFTHMLVHGLLHLCGFDHIDNKEAEEMEACEIVILASLGIENPYTEKNHPAT